MAGDPKNSIDHEGDGKDKVNRSVEYHKFRRVYLTAYLCATAADWLKGPYIYRLYEARGFSQQSITILFAAGYLSSAVSGFCTGMICDAFGRRRMCLVFCALYIIHALMHAFSDFNVLLAARIFSGVATSLLFSAFEAWMVAEHHRLGFPFEDLSKTFHVQTQCNAMVAVVAGLAAQGAVFVGGYAAPFGVSLLVLGVCAFIVHGWQENVGSTKRDFRLVVSTVRASLNWAVVRVGMLQCLFEGSMHIFVLLWTPCLQRGGREVPHGFVFSVYMLCMMLGGKKSFRPPLAAVFALASFCLAVPWLSSNFYCTLAAFCCFEWCCGCYFPQIAMLRSTHLAEKARTSIISLFRVPLNCLVVTTFFTGRMLPPHVVLLSASMGLACGTLVCLTLPGSPADDEGPRRAKTE